MIEVQKMFSRLNDLLVPAYNYRKEIYTGMAKILGTIDEVFYFGGVTAEMPIIEPYGDSFAIVSPETGTVIGYIGYSVDTDTNAIHDISVVSFDRGNLLIGVALSELMKDWLQTYRRIEWVMIGGNPVEKHYDKICKKYGGEKHVLHDVVLDAEMNYHDYIIYEIMNRGVDPKTDTECITETNEE